MRTEKLFLATLGISGMLAFTLVPAMSSNAKPAKNVATSASQSDSQTPGAGPKVVKITAKRFGFTPNQITLKKGEPVQLELTSEDVTHGFYMKALKLDEVIPPGKPTVVSLTPQTAGKFTTICDHFCGAGHGNMNMTITVED